MVDTETKNKIISILSTAKSEKENVNVNTNHSIQSENLKKVRNMLDLTQQALADSIQEKQTKIKDIESCKQKISVEFALKMEKKYNINFKWLLTGIGPMSMPSKKLLKNKREIDCKFSGPQLQELQAVNGLLDSQMAKILRISEKQYFKLTKSEKPLDRESIDLLMENFDVDLGWLIYGDEDIDIKEGSLILDDSKPTLPPLTPEQYRKLLDLLN